MMDTFEFHIACSPELLSSHIFNAATSSFSFNVSSHAEMPMILPRHGVRRYASLLPEPPRGA